MLSSQLVKLFGRIRRYNLVEVGMYLGDGLWHFRSTSWAKYLSLPVDPEVRLSATDPHAIPACFLS